MIRTEVQPAEAPVTAGAETAKTSDSAESVGSVIFTWKKVNTKQRVVVSSNETGRQMQFTQFLLCLLAVLLLCSGLALITVCIWSMLHRIPYNYLLNNSSIVDANNFNLCGAIVALPCFCIACASHDKRKSYLFLPLLIILLTFAVAMLTTGSVIGALNRSKMDFVGSKRDPKLVENAYKQSLRASLYHAMSLYDKNFNYRSAWNRAQIRLNCCGVESHADWLVLRSNIPDSCFLMRKYKYVGGCLDKIAADIAWQSCMLTGIAIIVIIVQGTTILLAIYLYIKEKMKMKSGRTSLLK